MSCEAFVDGMAVRIDDETVFEPDALVRCGRALDGEATVILDPVNVVEVASPSTERNDALHKLTRYFRNASILHYLIVLPGQRTVLHHRRGEEGSTFQTAMHRTGLLRLDPPGLSLDIEAIFPRRVDGVEDGSVD